MDKTLESHKLAAFNEVGNLQQRTNLLSQLIQGLQDKTIAIWTSREGVTEERRRNQSAIKIKDGSKKVLTSEIDELEKVLKKKKYDLSCINGELDSLTQSEKDLKIREDSQSSDLTKLDEETKKAHEDLNLTAYRNEIREFLCKPTLVKDPIQVLKDEIKRLESNSGGNENLGKLNGHAPALVTSSSEYPNTCWSGSPVPPKPLEESPKPPEPPTLSWHSHGQPLVYKPPISASAIKSCIVGELINDDALNFLLKEIVKKENDKYSVASTFWLSKKLIQKTNETEHLLRKSHIIAPINTKKGTHWALAHVDEIEKRIRFYDSLHFSGKVEMQQVETELNRYKSLKGISIFPYAKEDVTDIPFQEDNNSCGVYSLFFAKHIISNMAMNFDQDQVNIYRHGIVYKLINGKEPEPGCVVNGKDFLFMLNFQIKKRDNSWQDHKEVEIIPPKRTKRSPESSKDVKRCNNSNLSK